MQQLAIVTGGTRGIGKAISKALHDDNYIVVATYNNNDEDAQKLEKETNIKTFKWDVADFNACQENVIKLIELYNLPVSVLINNAGISRDGMFHKLELKNWADIINVNLNSCFNMCKAVIPSMREQNYGRIINISSINAQDGRIGVVNYSASKAGMLGLTRALAKESAIKGITVNAIAPGYIDTELLANVPESVIDSIINEVPLKRLGKPEEVARLVKFLASPESGYITGETIAINGGHHMQ